MRRGWLGVAMLALVLGAACGDRQAPPVSAPASATSISTTSIASTSSMVTTGGIALQAAGIGVAPFGAPRDDVVARVTALLGPPTSTSGPFESGSSPFGVCPGEQVWSVEWHLFRLLFVSGLPADRGRDQPVLHTFFYGRGGVDPVGARPQLFTDVGLTIGETLRDVKRRYGAGAVETYEELPGAQFGFAVASGDDRLFGYLTSADDDGVVQSIQAGAGCGE